MLHNVTIANQGAIAKRKRNLRLKAVYTCHHCSKQYNPSHLKQTCCSLACSQKLSAHKKGATTGILDRQKCATCHAIIGMSGALSGLMVGLHKSEICRFRKQNGLKTLTPSQAYQADPRRRQQQQDAWKLSEWEAEWSGVVDNYWTRCNDVVIAKMCDPDMRGRSDTMVKYYLDLTKSRRISAERSRRKRHNPNSTFAIRKKLRNHIARVCRISKTCKTRKTIEYLGCDINHARNHIQKHFKPGMEWNNHGAVWEIDHIVPMSHFDLNREDQRLIVNHFTNLCPEFKRYNREKGSRMIGEHQLCML
jgi:hypothetical protein